MNDLKSYRLNSLEEPTDEQLQSVVAPVVDMGRVSSRKAQDFMNRKMEEVRQFALSKRSHTC